MNSNNEFDIQEFISLDAAEEGHPKSRGHPPYPEDPSAYADHGPVSMPVLDQPQDDDFLSGNFSYNFAPQPQSHNIPAQHNAGHRVASSGSQGPDLGIPSITVEDDERHGKTEIYSPMYQNADSPYDQSPFDYNSPMNVPFPGVSVPQPPHSPDWDANGTNVPPQHNDFRREGNWDDGNGYINDLLGDLLTGDPQSQSSYTFHPQMNLGMPQQPVGQSLGANSAGQTIGSHSLASSPHSSPMSFKSPPINLSEPPEKHTRKSRSNSYNSANGLSPVSPAASGPGSTLQVPGSELYGSPGSDQYLSAPSSPSLSPSSPRSGRSSPLMRRSRAYSSPYELSTDGDASSPGDTGYVLGNRRKVKKNPSLYPCDQCDKKFTRAYNLRSHMRTHTHERPFACSVCGKAFARQHDRKRHEDLHTGEKRFKCSGTLASEAIWGCGRRFARADALGRHFRTEAGKTCIAPLREDIVSKVGQTENISEGIIFRGMLDGEAKLITVDTDGENQTRRAVLMSALTEQITADFARS